MTPDITGEGFRAAAIQLPNMSGGIWAEVTITSPESCPIARVSETTRTPIHEISRSMGSGTSGTVTEEFVLDADESNGGSPSAGFEEIQDDIGADEVFSYGTKSVYRFSRAEENGCPCELIEQFDSPVVDVRSRDGVLVLVFHAKDMDALRNILLTLRDRYPNTDVQRLLRSDGDRTDNDLVLVDRGSLTNRQREVLETAYEMGYFEHPKEANAGETAASLGITTSTFTEHLSAAQRKLLAPIFDR